MMILLEIVSKQMIDCIEDDALFIIGVFLVVSVMAIFSSLVVIICFVFICKLNKLKELSNLDAFNINKESKRIGFVACTLTLNKIIIRVVTMADLEASQSDLGFFVTNRSITSITVVPIFVLLVFHFMAIRKR